MVFYKKNLQKLFVSLLLTFCLIFLMNYIVDPYGYNSRSGKFIKNLTMFNKPHVTNARINSKGYYFLIGSSRMARVDPQVIEKLTGKKTHNIKLDGATLLENTFIASKVKEKGSFFIYSFDAFSFNKNRQQFSEIINRYEVYKDEIDVNFVINKYFNSDVTIRSLQHLLKKIKGESLSKQYISEDNRYSGYSAYKTYDESGIFNNKIKANFSNYAPYNEESVIKLAKLGTKNDIFIIFPKFVEYYQLFSENQDIESAYFSGIKTLVNNTDAKVWIFYGNNKITNNIDNFVDNGWHFKPKLTKRLFNEVFNYNSKIPNDLQGILLDKKNLNIQLNKLSDEISSLRINDK